MAKPKQRLKEGVTVGPTGVVSIANDGAGIAQDTINKVGEYNANITGGKAVSPTTPRIPVISPKLQAKMDGNVIDTTTGKPVSEAVPPVATVTTPVTTVVPPVTTEAPAPVETTPPVVTTPPETVKTPVYPTKGTGPDGGVTNKDFIDAGYTQEQINNAINSGTTLPGQKVSDLEFQADSTKVKGPGELKGELKGMKQEITEVEKNAQATGIQYTMKDGQPVYNPTTKEEAMKVLQMGGKVGTETKLSKIAQTQLDKVRNLGQLSDKNLSQKIVKGEVSAKDLEMLGVINPELVAKAKELSAKANITNNANAIAQDNNNIVNGVDAPIQNTALNTLLKKLEEIDTNKETYAEIKARVYENYPDMEVARNEIVTAQTELRQLQRNKRDLFDDYKAQNSGLPISMIMAGYSALSRNLDDAIYEVNDTLSQNVSLYNSYLEEANAEIDWEINNEKAQEDRLWNMYGVTRAEEVRSEDIQREDARIEQSIALEEARYERDIERQDFVSARERQQKLDDLRNDQNYVMETGLLQMGINPDGMTPEEMKSTYAQATAYYKQAEMDAANRPKASDYLKTTITSEDGSTREVYVNPITNETIDPRQAFGETTPTGDVGQILAGFSEYGQQLLSVPDGTVIPTRLGEVSPQNAKIRGKECAEYVNDIAGTKMGSTYESKIDICTEPTGGIGSVVAWKPNGSGQYGHTGIKVGEDENFEYIKSSNYVPGTVTTEAIPKGVIKNYYTPDSVKQAQEQEGPKATQYKNGNVRTSEGLLYDKKEVSGIKKEITGRDEFKRMQKVDDLGDSIEAYQKVFDKYGTETGLDRFKITGTGATELKNAYLDVVLNAKEYFNLGVLNGPDLSIITSWLPAPVDVELPGENGKSFKVQGRTFNNKVQAGIDSIRNRAAEKIKSDYDSLSNSYNDFDGALGEVKTYNDIYQKWNADNQIIKSY